MKILSTLVLSVLISSYGFSQKLDFKIHNVKDTTVYLIKYVGSKLYYADTAQIKNGIVSFDGSKQEPGILGILLPGQKYFEFIYDANDVSIETSFPDFMKTMKVKKGKENQIFVSYMAYMKAEREKANKLKEQRKALDSTKISERKTISKKIQAIGDEVAAYQTKIVNENPEALIGKVIKMSKDIQIPDAPVDADGSPLDSNFTYHYFRKHFFDNIDLTDDRLVNTPILQKKLEYYYSDQMLIQHPDTLIKYLDVVLKKIPEGSMMYRFFVTNITAHFEKSKIMGLDKVTNFMVREYYCAQDAKGNHKGYWMDTTKIEDVCSKAHIRKNLMVGEIPPNLILPDSTNEKWYNLYNIKADYIILYFWNPDCGHCKKITPKLEQLYVEKLKDRNVKVYSVGDAQEAMFKDWKDFIKNKQLTFINVGVTPKLYKMAKDNPYSILNSFKGIPKGTSLEDIVNSINYQKNYDVFATPTVFVLDKDKKIIAKSLSMAQIERMLDRLQGKENAKKILKLEDNDMPGSQKSVVH